MTGKLFQSEHQAAGAHGRLLQSGQAESAGRGVVRRAGGGGVTCQRRRGRGRYGGFSLAEVLLAVGTLAIGMIFIGGTFLLGIHFSTISTERTTAAVAANEAFAKIRLFGVDPRDPNLAANRLVPFEQLSGSRAVSSDEYAYPSTRTLAEKQYFWSALCRLSAPDPNHTVQVTVFISRKVGAGTMYEGPGGAIDRPVAMLVGIVGAAPGDIELQIEPGKEHWVNPGCTIVEDSTGEIYRVVDHGSDRTRVVIDPDKAWLGGSAAWVVPPPIGGGKRPDIAVYQKVISF